jgi:hypothetical protein
MQMRDAHLAQDELVQSLLRDEGRDHVLDVSNLHLSKLHLIVYCEVMHHDRSCGHRCDNEPRRLSAVQRFAELPGDHHHGTNDQNLDDHDLLADDHDLLADDPLNHRDYKTDDLRDHRDQKTADHDLLADDPLNHRDYKPDDHRDQNLDDHDLLADDPLSHHDHTTDGLPDQNLDVHDLDRHFDHTQDDLLDDCLDEPDDLPDQNLGDPDLQQDDRNDHLRHLGVKDAQGDLIHLPVADDVDRDRLG